MYVCKNQRAPGDAGGNENSLHWPPYLATFFKTKSAADYCKTRCLLKQFRGTSPLTILTNTILFSFYGCFRHLINFKVNGKGSINTSKRID
jgi:hypothetical protein